MGGFGSTRWSWHSKKVQVEDCYKMTIFSLKPYLWIGYTGTLRWLRGEWETGSISYRMVGDNVPNAVRLSYTIKNSFTNSEEKGKAKH